MDAMSTTLGAAPSTDPVESPSEQHGVTWRRVLTSAAIGQLAMAVYLFAITLAFDGRFDPMPVVIGGVAGVGVWWLRRPSSGRGAVVYAGVVSVLLLLMMLAFGGMAALLRPESTFELILFGGFLVASLLGVVAVPGAFRSWPASPVAAAARVTAVVAVVGFAVVGVVAGIVSGTATRMAGDLSLRAKNYEFNRSVIEVPAGRVAVFVKNDDVASHDFTITGVVHKELPGQKAGRAVFDIEPGSYRFYCSLHPDMEGMLKAS